jgi:methyl-accepting chemotaxis protein
MKLATQLLLPPVLTAFVALAGGTVGSVVMQREATRTAGAFNGALDDLRHITSAQEQMGRLHAGVYRTLTLIGSMDEASVKTLRQQMPAQLQTIAQVAQTIASRHEGDQALHEGASAVASQLAAYVKQADQAIDLASVDPNTGVAAMHGADASFKHAAQAMVAMIDEVRRIGEQAQADSATRGLRTAIGSGLLSVLLTLAVVLVSAWLLRRQVQALRQASALVAEVAQGDLSTRPVSARRDEIGDLQRDLARMIEKLNASMHEVQLAAHSVAHASGEIATGNLDLSQRTEHAASNLQQTAASLQELTGNVRHSADSASQATQLASSASKVAERGGQVVAQVVRTMDEINASSRKIADITGVIDGIAFQTNILALNAAVEAARAGEQGRGFAVVAGEVRTLAQRSAEAAKEIKSLIGSSVDRVENGARQVQDAGTTMTEIVGSVRRVNDIIGEITAAASEQSQGIGQVNTAVNQLDQMTQQNAALVEESAAAAESLKEQAQRLMKVVATFRLGSHGARVAGQPVPASF